MTSSGKINYYSSISYMWSSEDYLAQGATGQVFIGYDKKSGQKVAIKMFTRQSEFKAMQNEMQTIRQLPKHDNIVQFLEVEEQEKQTGIPIIVMELCNGGSLYEVIDAPENAYGIDEDQFKRVILHVSRGLCHLKRHGFAHRDIKPGNIMRLQDINGSYIFKLADFGTARKLAPEEKFTSLHGTEEYLYPAMYERALINPRAQREFVDKVDLWSVGATLFHIATGRLPFQPYRKRNDNHTMYRIISNKKSGVILGWQNHPDADIFYSSELPPDCAISVGLSFVITPVLAGLLETDFMKMMNFKEFFDEVERIAKLRVVDVFCVSRCTLHKVYLDPDNNDVMPALKRAIHEQTILHPQHMELYHENIPFKPIKPIKTTQLPVTTAASPLTVFGGPPQKADMLYTPELPLAPRAHSEISMVEDLRFSKDSTKVAWAYMHAAQYLSRSYRLMHQAALCLGQTVQQEFSSLKMEIEKVAELYNILFKQLGAQSTELHAETGLLNAINSSSGEALKNELKAFDAELSKKNDILRNLKEERSSTLQIDNFSYQIDHLLDPQNWDTNLGAEIFNNSIEKMKFYVEGIDELFQKFQSDKKRKVSPQDVFHKRVHDYRKRAIVERLRKAEEHVKSMVAARSTVYGKLYQFLAKCITVREEVSSFKTSLHHKSIQLQQTAESLEKWAHDHEKRLAALHHRLSSIIEGGGSSQSVSSVDSTVVNHKVVLAIEELRTRMKESGRLIGIQRTILDKFL